MGSTHLSLHLHLIFGTKDHELFIAKEWRPRLHAYMGGILTSLDTIPEVVGGVDDHIHILAGIRATRALADVMRELKSASSRWVHEEIGLSRFAWQEGYGAFSVSARNAILCGFTLRDRRNTTNGVPFEKNISIFYRKAELNLIRVSCEYSVAPPGLIDFG